jgi:hypothetical protein
MKNIIITFFSISLLLKLNAQENSVTIDSISHESGYSLFSAKDTRIQYTGRIDFSDPSLPRFWSPGVYITVKFSGPSCEAEIIDEQLYGTYHNYLELVVDNQTTRVQTKQKINYIKITGLTNKEHLLTICKNTESGIGYIEFAGIRCNNLLMPPPKPLHKIEFIGNSITCGFGNDISSIACNTGQWYDQHNAYMSYGPITARALNAQWVLSAVSGVGLIHSCCNMSILMPQVFDKLNLRNDSIECNFKNYQPDIVTICLGQNDGIQDSTKFCKAYIDFIWKMRSYYPKAAIFCLTSPMADSALTAVLKKYISSIVIHENAKGDKNIFKYFFTKRFHNGCSNHPDLQEHEQIAKELVAYIRKIMNW